jgi:hypothetical protein
MQALVYQGLFLFSACLTDGWAKLVPA